MKNEWRKFEVAKSDKRPLQILWEKQMAGGEKRGFKLQRLNDKTGSPLFQRRRLANVTHTDSGHSLNEAMATLTSIVQGDSKKRYLLLNLSVVSCRKVHRSGWLQEKVSVVEPICGQL